jgi:hypothetical protein
MERFAVLLAAAMAVLTTCRSAPAPVDIVSGASSAGRDAPPIGRDIAPMDTGRRVLVVYFSQGSAVRRVAEDLAYLHGAAIERIVEKKARKGLFGFLSAGADASLGKATPIEAPVLDPARYDLVVVCTPVWAGRLAPPIRSWLSEVHARLPECAYVVVSAATAPEKVVAMMLATSGRAPVAYVGFVQKDFSPESRATYVRKLRDFVGVR